LIILTSALPTLEKGLLKQFSLVIQMPCSALISSGQERPDLTKNPEKSTDLKNDQMNPKK